MPYKDPEQKRAWERLHRFQRLARRRELRRTEAAREQASPEDGSSGAIETVFLLPVAAGSALAAYNPKLAMLTGGGTLVVAGLFKKGLSWWIFGALLLAFGLFMQLSGKKRTK